MKINKFTLLLSLLLAGIIAIFFSVYVIGPHKYIIGIGAFLTLGITMAGMIGISFDYDRTTTLTRTASGIFFVSLLASQILFVLFGSFQLATYVLVAMGVMTIYVMVMYGLSRSKH